MGRRSVMAAFAALVVGAGTLAGPAQAAPADPEPAAAAAPLDCPAPVAAQVDMVGDGWTVVQGTTPRRFGVKVLGVLTDGIGAGRDLIIIEAYDLPGQDFIARRRHLGWHVRVAPCMSVASYSVRCRTASPRLRRRSPG